MLSVDCCDKCISEYWGLNKEIRNMKSNISSSNYKVFANSGITNFKIQFPCHFLSNEVVAWMAWIY